VLRVSDQNADGYADLLVGAPGIGQGHVYCLSGAFLAFGTGPQTLWTLAPPGIPGDQFGSSIANVGDLTGDGVEDFVVGEPGVDTSAGSNVGMVRLLNGSTHLALSTVFGVEANGNFGAAVADLGAGFVAVGAPGPGASFSRVYYVSKSSLLTSGTPSLSWDYPAVDYFGASLSNAGDLNGDGFADVVVGAPERWAAGGVIQAGGINLISTDGTSFTLFGPYNSAFGGEHLGASVDASQDFDGDGVHDIVVGAPNAFTSLGTPGGRVVVLSGARVSAQTPPYEIYNFTTGGNADYRFGTAVCAVDDLNNDGVPDIIGGQPNYSFFGGARIFSGASGAQIAFVAGSIGNHLGDAIGGAVDDFDGDGFREFVVAGSSSDVGGTDIGVVKCYRLFPLGASTYCTAKVNSQGCTPAIAFTGSASESSPSPFVISASNIVNHKNGLLFYSHAPISTAFQGGFKCAADPVLRTTIVSSGGSTSGADCTGTYSLDFNALIQSGSVASLVAGAEVYAQWWSRDPVSTSHTSLSNAVQFVINP